MIIKSLLELFYLNCNLLYKRLAKIFLPISYMHVIKYTTNHDVLIKLIPNIIIMKSSLQVILWAYPKIMAIQDAMSSFDIFAEYMTCIQHYCIVNIHILTILFFINDSNFHFVHIWWLAQSTWQEFIMSYPQTFYLQPSYTFSYSCPI